MSATPMSDDLHGVPLLRCRGLAKKYGSTTALAELDLSLHAGPPVALVGPNGAGKTTLMSLLAGYVRPSQGVAEVFGVTAGSAAVDGRLTAVPQDAVLHPRQGIGHQLALLARLQGFNRSAARVEATRVLELVDLSEVAARKPTALSHGMRKRVALAQAFIGEPELVLLDEPTAGIDPENARAIRELITQRARSTTFIVSSHNLDELERLCGSVIQLERGRLLRHEILSGSSVSSVPTTAAAGSRNEPLSMQAQAPDVGSGELTLQLERAADREFEAAVLALDSVRGARQLSGGDWRLDVDNEALAAAAVLGLVAERGWSWRHVVRGRSLEERLYGRD